MKQQEFLDEKMEQNMTKECTSCTQIKDISEFNKVKNYKDGLQYVCRKCEKLRRTAYHRTKKGLVNRIYSSQKGNSKQRGHRPPEYTKQELKEWLFSQTLFHELFLEWKQSGYLKRLTPSVDRKHDYIHYCMKNVQLMSWGENNAKGHADHKSGKIQYDQKPVLQYTKDGELVAEYRSRSEASRQTEVNPGNISLCCTGNRKSAGGFIWKYARTA